MLIEPTAVSVPPAPPRESVSALQSTSFLEELSPDLPPELPPDLPPDLPLLLDDDVPPPPPSGTRTIEEPPAGRPSAPRRSTTEVGFTDFGTFGTPPDAQPGAEPPGFASLDIESSEGVHALPLDESMLVEEPLVEAEPMFGDLDLIEPPPAPPRPTSTVLAVSVDSLKERVVAMPEDWALRRQYAEALLDAGQKEIGVSELEVALAGFERDGDLDTATSIAEEIVRLAPTVIKYHQKRVEFAFRANDRMSLAEAYVELADALVKDGQAPKARVVYQRVLEISPDDIRAQAALETIVEAPVPEPTPPPRRSTTATRKSTAISPTKPTPTAPKKKQTEEEFVSLGDWLREDEVEKNTRMVVEEKEPTGDEQADFADMLRKFKQGVSDNVDDEDHEAHYDLGVAYKEMGLLDEAISEFQKSLRGTSNRVRAIEALGVCFVEKTQLPVAATILQRALSEPGVRDDALIGVLYLLGNISEELQLLPDAKKYYERVFAVDIQFRDVGDRLNAVEKKLK